MLLLEPDLFRAEPVSNLLAPIWSTALKLGLNDATEAIELTPAAPPVGGLLAKLDPPVYKLLVIELYFSFNYLFNQFIICLLLSKLLNDYSILAFNSLVIFWNKYRSFSNFYLSILSSLISLFFSLNEFIFSWIWSSYFWISEFLVDMFP